MNMFWALLAMAFGSFGGAPAVADQGNPQFQSLTNSFNTAIIQSQKIRLLSMPITHLPKLILNLMHLWSKVFM